MFQKSFLLILVLLLESHSVAIPEAAYGEYFLKGKIYLNGEPLAKDSVRFVLIHYKHTVTRENISYLHTDQHGNYEKKILWFIPCPSSPRPKECKGDFTREQCDSVRICMENPVTFGFYYHDKHYEMKNRFYSLVQPGYIVRSADVTQDIFF